MNNLQKGTNDTNELGYTIYRLCMFVTTRTADSFAQQAIGTLVQLALMDLGRGRYPLSKVRSNLSERYHLDFEEIELEDLVQDTAKLGLLQWQESDRTLSLSWAQSIRMEKQRKQGFENQERVLNRWRNQVQIQYPSCSADDLQILMDDLKYFLTQLVMRWSKEFLAAVYPNLVEANGNLANEISNALDMLPNREAYLRDMREKLISEFLLSPESETKGFLVSLLDAAIVVCALTIDPKSALILKGQLKNFTLYVDTNLIIFLLGLSDPKAQVRAKRLVELSNEAGVRLMVSPRTLTEFREVLTQTKDNILKDPKGIRQEALERLREGRHGPLTAYVEKCDSIKRPISPDDFFGPFILNVEGMLDKKGIKVDTALPNNAVDQSRLKEETQYLKDNVAFYKTRTRTSEHDAYHFLLIQALRGAEPQPFGPACIWFLTCDTRLPPYALKRRRAEFEAPFCILSSAWLAFLRTMRPRTQDFDRDTSELLFEPAFGLYQELVGGLLERANAKYEAIASLDQEEKELTLASQLFEKLTLSEGQEQVATAAGEDSSWLEELAEPAARGELTSEIRRHENSEAERAKLAEDVNSLKDQINKKDEHTQRNLRGIAIGTGLVFCLIVVHVYGYLPIRFLLPGMLWISIVATAFAIPWKTLGGWRQLAIQFSLLTIVFIIAVFVFGFDTVWKWALGLFAAAGFIRVLGWLNEKYLS